LEQSHNGPAIARNLGARQAKGEILVFVDADMTFHEDFLKKLISPILVGKAIGTFSKEEYVSNWNNVWARCWNYNQNLKGKKRLPNNYPNTQKVFRAINKAVFLKSEGFEKGGYTDDYSLADKLGFGAKVAYGAKFYHKNPDTLREVFNQSRWVAKRKYKFGILGFFYALFRVSLPISGIIGIYKSIKYKTAAFFVFKIVYNTGATFGIIDYYLFKRGTK
jgi:glycosyltransferase involved in cell wall biosynthesis